MIDLKLLNALVAGETEPRAIGIHDGERVKELTVDDVKARAAQALRWQLANGVQAVRSHVDVCDPELRALRGLTELREELRGAIDLQLVAFPQQGILSLRVPPGRQHRPGRPAHGDQSAGQCRAAGPL
jgi:hypothetical protein